MWPKLLSQLIPQVIDLLPHMKRVVPMADKFLSSKAASDAALVSMAEGVRSDLGKVSEAHAGLSEQIDSLAAQVALASAAVDRSNAAALTVASRVEIVERQMRSLRALLVSLVVLTVVLLLLDGWLTLTHVR